MPSFIGFVLIAFYVVGAFCFMAQVTPKHQKTMDDVNFQPLQNLNSKYHAYASVENQPLCLHIVKSSKNDTYFVFIEDAFNLNIAKDFRVMSKAEILIEHGIVID